MHCSERKKTGIPPGQAFVFPQSISTRGGKQFCEVEMHQAT